MDKLILHPSSRSLIEAFISQPKHALLVEGQEGSGTLKVAQTIGESIGSTSVSLHIIKPENNTIAIETIRNLYTMSRSVRKDVLVITIDDADAMGSDAQNSLLKLLEEPPRSVYFILTTHAPHKLLPTILSRVERLVVRPVSREDSLEYIKSLGVTEAKEQTKLLFLAAGKPAELKHLVMDPDYYEASAQRMSDARLLVEGSMYDKLLLLRKYSSDRVEAESFLSMVGQLLSHSVYKNIASHSVHSIDTVVAALDALRRNGNIRAQLLRVCDQLP